VNIYYLIKNEHLISDQIRPGLVQYHAKLWIFFTKIKRNAFLEADCINRINND